MKPTTRQQRIALKKVFDRRRLYPGGKTSDDLVYAAGWRFEQDTIHGWTWKHPNLSVMYRDSESIVSDFSMAQPIKYLHFRRTVKQGWDCLMVPWAGMWLGIERDGYTHS